MGLSEALWFTFRAVIAWGGYGFCAAASVVLALVAVGLYEDCKVRGNKRLWPFFVKGWAIVIAVAAATSGLLWVSA